MRTFPLLYRSFLVDEFVVMGADTDASAKGGTLAVDSKNKVYLVYGQKQSLAATLEQNVCGIFCG